MKTMKQLVPAAMKEISGLALTPAPTENARPHLSPPKAVVKRPCRSDWQQKWIGLDITSPVLQEVANAAQSFCARWIGHNNRQSLLVLVGASGTGKTHVAKRIYRFCSAARMNAAETGFWGPRVPTTFYQSWPEAVTEFGNKQFGVMEDLLQSDLLVLDDIGAEDDPWNVGKDKLCQILSRREKRFTVVTTNIDPKFWAKRFDARIEDRLLRNSIVKMMTGVTSYAFEQ